MPFWERLTPTQRRLLLVGVPIVAALAVVATVRDRDDEAEEEDDGQDSGVAGDEPAGERAARFVEPPATFSEVGQTGQTADHQSRVTEELRAQRQTLQGEIADFESVIAETSRAQATVSERLAERVDQIAQRITDVPETVRSIVEAAPRPRSKPEPQPAKPKRRSKRQPKPKREGPKRCSKRPGLPQRVKKGMARRGERVVDVLPTPTNCGALYLSQVGGVFAVGDANFRGSVPGLPGGGDHVKANAPFVKIRWADKPGGRYVVISSNGNTFRF